MIDVAIIVPTFNEKETVEKYVHETMTALSSVPFDYRIVFVDDSKDDTFGILKKLADENKRIYVIHRNRTGRDSPIQKLDDANRVVVLERSYTSLSSAVIDGFRSVDARKYIVMDVDLQHPPEFIPSIVEALDRCDFVVGSRYVEGAKIDGWSLYRYFISKSFIYFAKIILPAARKINDVTAGFFGVRKNVVDRCIDELNGIGWKIMLEVLVKGKPEKVCEVPIVFRERAGGESKAGVKVAMDGLKQLIELRKYL